MNVCVFIHVDIYICESCLCQSLIHMDVIMVISQCDFTKIWSLCILKRLFFKKIISLFKRRHVDIKRGQVSDYATMCGHTGFKHDFEAHVYNSLFPMRLINSKKRVNIRKVQVSL